MSLAVVQSRAQTGTEAPPVSVEVHLAPGLPRFSIVGLPELAVKESRDRVRSAIQNSGFQFPQRRVIVSLAPAELPKAGGRFDLPIALGVLAASGQIPQAPLAELEFIAELALTGALRPVRGVLPVSLAAYRAHHALIVAPSNAVEAALVTEACVHPATSLLAVTGHLHGSETLPRQRKNGAGGTPLVVPDLADVMGQARAKRALEVAAAGGHNLLFLGPPGTGKSMLAARLPGILPPMDEAEALGAATVASISNAGFNPRDWGRRPFRHPHHTASAVALVGGSSPPKPGEISLANEGVLFLDELPEFQRRVLEVLREPMESGRIVISRAAHQAEFPARFQLVAAMNPCPCGYLGDGSQRCHCTAEQVRKYRARVSGPLLDRIDLQVEVPRLKVAGDEMPPGENSAAVRARVVDARERQLKRQKVSNARLEIAGLRAHCTLDKPGAALLDQAVEKLNLSTRARHRILKLARTIADLADTEQIKTAHLAEAIGYRQLDRRV